MHARRGLRTAVRPGVLSTSCPPAGQDASQPRDVECAGRHGNALVAGRSFEAAEGTRTLDLLHGKQTSMATFMHVLPANVTVPGFRHLWGVVRFRRVLRGLCQPIVNRRLDARLRLSADGFRIVSRCCGATAQWTRCESAAPSHVPAFGPHRELALGLQA